MYVCVFVLSLNDLSVHCLTIPLMQGEGLFLSVNFLWSSEGLLAETIPLKHGLQPSTFGPLKCNTNLKHYQNNLSDIIIQIFFNYS